MDRSGWRPSSWDYSITFKDGLFYAHPRVFGGPFHSLGEVAAAIKCYPVPTWTYAQLLRGGYSFTLKGGLFHVSLDGVGGPFKFLADAMDAVWRHGEWKWKQQERSRNTREYLNNVDPAACLARVRSFIKMYQSAERDTKAQEPVMSECVEYVLGRNKPSTDPAVLEEVDRLEWTMEKKETIRNRMKWMENEVSMYEFVNLDQQCLIYDTFSESYHHYNFTMKKKSSRKHYELFFAEVKPTKEGKQYFCCPLKSNENGRCFGCENVGVDLKHPTTGKYEKGNEHSGFPFDSDSGGDE